MAVADNVSRVHDAEPEAPRSGAEDSMSRRAEAAEGRGGVNPLLSDVALAASLADTLIDNLPVCQCRGTGSP